MMRATVSYCFDHGTGSSESIEVELSTDANYTPDLATDLAARARATLAKTVADMWPEPEVATP